MGTSSAAEVMKAWMDSLGHKIAILSKNNTHIGVGYYKGHWVQTFSDNPDKKCTFTINANGGVFSDGTSIKFFVIQHIFNRFQRRKYYFRHQFLKFIQIKIRIAQALWRTDNRFESDHSG